MVTVINEIFKLPPYFDPFGYVNYLYELSLGHSNYPTQKWYIWASSQISGRRFRKLQEAIWLTVINEIFKLPPYFDPFGYMNYLYELSLGYSNYPTQKWYIWASFQISGRRFPKSQEAILFLKVWKLAQMYHFWIGYFEWPEKSSYK